MNPTSLYIFLGMCAELMNINYEAADRTVYLNSVKMTIPEREAEYNAFCEICSNLGYTLDSIKTSGGYYSLWFMNLEDLNLKIVYDFGCYLEALEEND